MICDSCLSFFIEKLLPEDIIILEFLYEEKANMPQCSMSRNHIKYSCNLSEYKCYTALDRLEILGMIEKSNKTKTSRYWINNLGEKTLNIIRHKMGVG
jgi:hypothetical protein